MQRLKPKKAGRSSNKEGCKKEKIYEIDYAYLYYAVTTHLRLPEVVFWTATHRKIVELLDIDKEVNSINTNNKTKKNSGSKKMSLQEAMKIL